LTAWRREGWETGPEKDGLEPLTLGCTVLRGGCDSSPPRLWELRLYSVGVSTDDLSLTRIQARAAQEGDEAAMEALFRRYLPRVARIVATRLGRSWRELGLEDDVVQETLLDAFTALRENRIADEAAFSNWIARCVENNIQDQLRHGRTQRRGGGKVDRFADLAESYLSDSMLDGGHATPSQHASTRETEARLEQALLKLDPRYREVISLRVYCGMPHGDIAEAMGLRSENTANVLFLRAREELRKRLEIEGL
jgi:RNA polymerase sigma factor (sigma-70 family)